MMKTDTNAPKQPNASVFQKDTHSAVRQQLLEAAAELFFRQGYANTSVREIASAAHVSKPCLYYYFKNKKRLLQELICPALDRVSKLVAQLSLSSRPARVRIYQIGEKLNELMDEDRLSFRLVGSLIQGSAEARHLVDVDGLHNRMRTLVETIIEQGIAQGEFSSAPIPVMASVILSVLHYWIFQSVSEPRPPTAPRIDLATLLCYVQLGLLRRND